MRDQARNISIEVLTEIREIHAWVGAWDELLEGSYCNRAFSSADWFLSSLAADPELKPLVLVAYRDGIPAGIFPLAVRDGVAGFASGLADYNDVIVAPGELGIARALVARARELGSARLELFHVRPDANLVAALETMDLSFRFEDHVPARGYCPYLQLPGDFEAFLATRKPSHRKELRRISRKAAEAGLQIRELAPDRLAPSALPDLFLELHAARFGEASVFQRPKYRSFVAKALPALFAAGRLRVVALLHGGDILGVEVLMVGPDSLCDWNGGFQTTPVKCSPGHLLILGGIRRTIELGLREYDLLRGVESYKARWADMRRPFARIRLPATAGGHASTRQ